ncbi:Translation initiation factor IF-2 [Bienertia sinuspersici]
MAIRADRRNYVMSVEFAMQREMEYRENLEKQGPLKCRVVEEPRPTSSQDSRITPRPMINPYLQNPGSAPSARPPPYPNQPQQLRPSPSSAGPSRSSDHQRKKGLPPGIFTCKVCQIDCTTGFNLLTHYQGQKHRARLRGVKGKEVDNVGATPKLNERRPYCDLCGIWCADEHTYRLHFSCPNHILRQYDCMMKRRAYS